LTALLRLVRRLAAAPGFRRLTRFEPLLRLSFALRGSLTRSPLSFARNELRPGRGALAVYELRDGGAFVALRHKTPDVLLFDEIFSQREYELPGPVARLIADLRPLNVVDVGANIGLFGAFISRQHPQTEIVAIEPDEANVVVLRRCAQANAAGGEWRVVSAAAATSDGTVRFVSGDYSLSRIGAEGEPVAAVDVFPYLAEAHLVKIDVEGAEWPILADPRFRRLRAPVVVLEYHREGCPGGDPVAEVERALGEAGYEVALGPSKPAYGAGIVWGWREAA
jgi:FkbM family methyltransferase